MIIKKNIVLGSIEVDTDNGKIWVNSHECILRIQDIKFQNIEEKFSMIDINKDKSVMYPKSNDIDNNTEFNDFLEKISLFIFPKLSLMNKEESFEFLNSIYLKIFDFIKK